MQQLTAHDSHILIVDDDEDLAEMIRSFLSSNGFDVRVVGDGTQAVGLIEADPPRLIVLDLMLPGTDPTDPTDPVGNCPNPSPPVAGNALDSDETISGLSGSEGSIQQYYIDVPGGQTRLVIRTWGGSGDADLYVARDREASPDDHDYGPYLEGNTETVRVRNPPAGRWYITLHGFEAFNSVKLQATIIP